MNYKNEVYPLLKELCSIPAPSNFEDKRAEFCKNYLLNCGYEKVYIDDAKNVICEVDCDNSNGITVFAAHTDTVFPDFEPMLFYEEDGKAFCPGIGDDTASVAVLLVAAKQFKESGSKSKGMLFVCNSCEEGLGNLKGIKKLMETYGDRIARFIAFDSTLDIMVTKCVGSHRYLVKAETEGGHSFNKFGSENAISDLANIITKIYSIDVPTEDGSKTTYNVGTIEGGTSVNAIAQSATMLCEYRSDSANSLEVMRDKFREIFDSSKKDGVNLTITNVGERPCSKNVDESKQSELVYECENIIKNKINKPIIKNSGSTDCNIPSSMGVPSISVGVYYGGKSHTREEWVDIKSLETGLDVAIDLVNWYK